MNQKKSRGIPTHLRGVRCFASLHSATSQVLRKKVNSSFFPHISRKKTAKVFKNWQKRFFLYFNRLFKISFLFFVSCFLFLNLHSFLFPENEKLAKTKKVVLKNPFRSKAHESLARVYLEAGGLDSAERELWLAKNLFSPDQVSLKELEQDLKKAKEKPRKIRQEIEFWEEIIKEKPNYRDAYFQLAILNYQIYQKEKTLQYLQKTFELDANFEPAKKLEKLLSD